MKAYHWLIVVVFALIGAALMYGCGKSGLFVIFEPPNPNATADTGAHPITPFARDMRALCIPLVWGCILFGVITFVLSRWVPMFSAKVSATAVAAGFALLFSMHFLIRFEWVLNVVAIGSVVVVAFLLGHMVYLKFKGVEGSTPSHILPAFVREWFVPKPPVFPTNP